MRKRKRKPEGLVKGTISYIAALAMIVIFAVYLSGRTGWFLLSVMVILPILSVLTTLVIRNFISVEAEISESELYKNNSLKVRAVVKNRSYIPTPPVEITLLSSDALVCCAENRKCAVSIMPRSEQTAESDCTAKIWCAAQAGIEKVRIIDYTGLFSFKLKTNMSGLSFKVNIIPDVMDVQSSDGLLKSVNDSSAQNDDSDESRDSTALAFNGTPGYEHREYFPGDPVKRINWKLSMKKDSLMVRLDDEILSSKHTVVLDRVNSSENMESGEVCGEYMLGMLRAMARMGTEADIWYYSNGWKCRGISGESDVEQLRFSLAGYGFEMSADARVPFDEIARNGRCASLIFYTPCYDRNLSGQIQPEGTLAKTDMSVTVAAASIEDDVRIPGVWLLSKNGYSEIIL